MKTVLYTIWGILLHAICAILIILALIFFGARFKQDTRFAKGYTEEKFELIKIGMAEKEVINILGEPLVRFRPFQHTNHQNKKHYVSLQYSESPSSTNYHLRQIYLDHGKVAEIISYYYID